MEKNDMSAIPLGLGYALAENTDTLRYFANLSSQKQREIIDRSRTIASRAEMRDFVRNLTEKNMFS